MFIFQIISIFNFHVVHANQHFIFYPFPWNICPESQGLNPKSSSLLLSILMCRKNRPLYLCCLMALVMFPRPQPDSCQSLSQFPSWHEIHMSQCWLSWWAAMTKIPIHFYVSPLSLSSSQIETSVCLDSFFKWTP